MKSTIRSKLFLLTYGIILSFIVVLIVLNNTFLRGYYINNRQNALVDAFEEVADLNLEHPDLPVTILQIESEYNLGVQILKQDKPLPEDLPSDDFAPDIDIFNRIYGNEFTIPKEVLTKIIIDYNLGVISDEELNYGSKIRISSEYDAYFMDMNSQMDNNQRYYQMLGLVVADDIGNGEYVFYVLTITFSSITESIRIFNSFTILIGFVFMIVSGAVMYFLSYRFTNPILEINRIADEISKLDFSRKVEVTTDDELGDLGYSINRMSSQLEESIKELQLSNDKLKDEILYKNKLENMRKEFIANASHELKTPLSLIMGYAEALKLSDIDENSKKEYIDIILDESEKMNKLVKKLLKLSQLESGKKEIKFSEFSIKQLVLDTIKLFDLKLKEKNINVELDLEEQIVTTDLEEIQSVLTNFISNAINHVDDNRIIKVSVKTVSEKQIKVAVMNSGNHIPKVDIENIWESFYKVDKARNRDYGGQGLGLAICKTILELLGYDYGVKNVEQGVEFYFIIHEGETEN
jgi:signal transduction histidine kinase